MKLAEALQASTLDGATFTNDQGMQWVVDGSGSDWSVTRGPEDQPPLETHCYKTQDQALQALPADIAASDKWAAAKTEEEDDEDEKPAVQSLEIELDQLRATDLCIERDALLAGNEGQGMQAYALYVEGHVEAAQALYVPSIGRMGIAWGADATWADVESVENGIEMWRDGDAWNAHN